MRKPEPSAILDSIWRRPRKATSVSSTSPSTAARCPGELSQRHDAGAVLVAQRQQEQQILRGLDAERAQPLGLPLADAAQRTASTGLRASAAHKATMHSTSTCAPRGSEATPTAARAG